MKGLYLLAFDKRGNVAHALVSETSGALGNTLINYVFDAYGNPVRSSGVQPLGIQATPPDPWGFGAQAGYYGDGSLLLLTHRYYEPATGRFLTRDSGGYCNDMNLFRCVVEQSAVVCVIMNVL